jgi:hypothetical protein
MVAEHGEEAGYFGQIDAKSFMPEIGAGEPTIDAIDDYVNKSMTDILEDDSVMEKIEEEIREVTEGAQNEVSKAKNLKTLRDDDHRDAN